MESEVQRRFQIEDLIVQDASGVVFRALDTETRHPVAVRRFFPFGANGGGLREETAYEIALGRLAGLHHPALRAVICGGCDPVDGMPFIATEWIEGDLLGPILERGPLPAEDAAELLTQALEVCELLSHVLAEEAVWVETDPQTIVLGNAESGRGFTFWISPLKWLGGNDESRGLKSIITLTEQLMGWQGLVVNDQAGRGLGAWLNWLRGAENTPLREIRENLAAAIGSELPQPARKPVAQAAVPPTPKSPKAAVFAGLALAFILTGMIAWWLTRKPATPAMAGSGASQAAVSAVNKRAEELRVQAQRADHDREALLASQQAELEKQSGVFSIAQGDLLALQKGQTASLAGHLEKIESSNSGATLYLYFSQQPAANEPRGAIVLKNTPDLSRQYFEPFIGKEASLTGKVSLERGRPQLTITKRSDIQFIE